MPPALDWLGVTPASAPQTPYLTPAIPQRNYGLTARDAVMQGEDALPALSAGANYANILRQQALAPLQQQAEQQQLQNQTTVQPLINAGREDMIKSLAALDPASDEYLSERRNAVMQNPYGLADPIVQHVLRANDQAYDDYLSTRRVQMMGPGKPITPMQRASLQKQITAVTAGLMQATNMGDEAMISRYGQQLQALNDILQGAQPGQGGATEEQDPAVPGMTQPAAPSAAKFQDMSKDQRWTTAKELVLDAVEKEADSSGKTREEVMQEIGTDGAKAKDFFQNYLKVSPSALAFEEKTNPWYGKGYGNDMSWLDIFTSLQGDRDLLHSKGIARRLTHGMGTGEPFSHDAETENSGVKGKAFKIEPLPK